MPEQGWLTRAFIEKAIGMLALLTVMLIGWSATLVWTTHESALKNINAIQHNTEAINANLQLIQKLSDGHLRMRHELDGKVSRDELYSLWKRKRQDRQ